MIPDICGTFSDGVCAHRSSPFRGTSRSRLIAIACVLFGASGCLSATTLDAQLTALGRTASPLRDQSRAQLVDDATSCRESIMDGLLHVGAYALYNPVAHGSAAGAIHAYQRRLVQCLEQRGYALRVPPGPGGGQ